MPINKFATLLTLTCGLLACGGSPSETTGGVSQTSSSGGASSGSGTEAPGTSGGVTEGLTGGVTEGATMSGEVTAAPETGTQGALTETGEPGTSTGAGLCDGYMPPKCKPNDCAEGEECKVVEGVCVPTACSCDPETGLETCTPDCGGESCAPICGDVLCDIRCEFGFETDRNGCQICECVEGPPPAECGCKNNKDCVKTSSGCCPCNSGGDEVAAHKDCVDQVMQCDLPPEQVICPQVYLCTDVQPACVDGQCVLQ